MRTASHQFLAGFLVCSALLCNFASGSYVLASDSSSKLGGVLFDFESEAEIDDLEWKCRTFMARDAIHAVRGQHSLRVELYPDDYPGFKKRWKKMSWKGYSALEFTVFNPASSALELAYRIDDRANLPDYGDRFNGLIRLQPGSNTIHLAFKDLLTSKSHRPLEPESIFGLYLFMVRPERKTVFYLDAIMLVP